MASKVIRIISVESRNQLQELYNHLEHPVMGDKYMAWYGQCRAKEMSHEEAMRDTAHYWGFANQDWYQLRLRNAKVAGHPMRNFTIASPSHPEFR